MAKSRHIVVLVTAEGPEEAHKIAEALVKGRQAACVNIVPAVNSHFRWQGKLEAAQESLLIIKTRESLLPEVVKSVKKLHSYSVPEIIALPIVGGNGDYLEWLDSETIQIKGDNASIS